MGSLHLLKKNKCATRIDVKIVEAINENTFIIGDEKEAMILKAEKNEKKILVEGNSVRLIKPKFIDGNIIESHPSFPPMKIKPVETNVKEKVLDKLREIASMFQPAPGQGQGPEHLLTFKDLDEKPPNSEATLVVRVCSVTRPLEGKYSKFRFATIKDKDNLMNNLAIYPPHTEKLFEPGKLYKISHVKKTNYKKEGENYFRVSTQRKSFIKEFEDHAKIFENVTIGEFQTVGSILGHGDIMCYQGCTVSWLKVKQSGKCDAHAENMTDCETRNEFVTEIYLDVEDDVQTFIGFTRHFELNVQDFQEETIGRLLAEKFVLKDVRIDFNKDQDNAGKNRMIKMEMQH